MRNELLRKNNETLARLRESIDGSPLMSGRNLADAARFMGGGVLGMASGGSAGLGRFGGGGGLQGALNRLGLSSALKGGESNQALRALESRYGITVQELGRMAKEIGIELFGSDGKLIPDALRQLREAIELTIKAATQFGRNLDDIRLRQDARNRLFDLEGPNQQLSDSYDILNQMSPELMRQLGLSNLNLDTEAGRNVLLEGLRDIFRLIDSGQLTPELLGAFTDKGQLLEAILGTKDALDLFRNSLAQVNTDFPKAMDLLLYERLHATPADAYGGSGGTVGGGTARPPTGPARPHVPGTWGTGTHAGPIVIGGDLIIQPAFGEDGEEILQRVERAAAARQSQGGFTYLPNTVTEPT
jgi:hypothetical protein